MVIFHIDIKKKKIGPCKKLFIIVIASAVCSIYNFFQKKEIFLKKGDFSTQNPNISIVDKHSLTLDSHGKKTR